MNVYLTTNQPSGLKDKSGRSTSVKPDDRREEAAAVAYFHIVMEGQRTTTKILNQYTRLPG
jgi:hypothetical protein